MNGEIDERDVVAALARVERETGERVVVGAATVARVLDDEDRAAAKVTDSFYGDRPHLLPSVQSRVEDLLRRYLGYAGQDAEAYASAARMLAFATHHAPEHRPHTTVPRFDLTGWPFCFIDWAQAGVDLEARGAFGRDLFLVDGHLFTRALTTGEEIAVDEDWVRD
ncbi:MAG: hypothetical protein ACTH0V_00210 [Microbacteriaceae bacterium]